MVETILIVISVFYFLFMIREKVFKVYYQFFDNNNKEKTHFLGKTYKWSMFITF